MTDQLQQGPECPTWCVGHLPLRTTPEPIPDAHGVWHTCLPDPASTDTPDHPIWGHWAPDQGFVPALYAGHTKDSSGDCEGFRHDQPVTVDPYMRQDTGESPVIGLNVADNADVELRFTLDAAEALRDHLSELLALARRSRMASVAG